MTTTDSTAWQELVAKAVHDMRTPLSGMKTAIEVLRLAQGDPDKVARIISMMERQATELAGLLERLAKDPESYRSD
jgi:signal transduction histidine kinase